MAEEIVYTGRTAYGDYQIVDMIYGGREARVLFSGNRSAAQSGIPKDGKPELLFDYNQRFFELVTALKPTRLLMIGGGMFTLPSALIKTLTTVKIDVVELDPELQKLAQDYFEMPINERLKIIIKDGRSFINTTTNTYDMIIVDAFVNDVIPQDLYTYEAINHLKRILMSDGAIAVNSIAAYYGRASALLRHQVAAYENIFNTVKLFPANHDQSLWLPQNIIITAESNHDGVNGLLKYPALLPLQTTAADILHD